jgi:predicted GNAT superfamily acetyltransferase
VEIEYVIFTSVPKDETAERLTQLHQKIFGTSDDLIDKMAQKPQLLIVLAMSGSKVIGYKIGYELSNEIFYSWLGGVDPGYRGQGIATELMQKQHQFLTEKGYKMIRTKTMNRWRGMLVMNIKNGFDVINTYMDEEGLHKIILEKQL